MSASLRQLDRTPLGVDVAGVREAVGGLVERLDPSGRLEWAHVYSVGAYGTGFAQIATTSDGGFVVVGVATDANHHNGALIVRLDGLGNVLWDTELGPGSTAQAQFESVAVAADGAFVATGEFFVPSGDTRMNLLVAEFDGAGRLSWRDAFTGTNVDGGQAADRGFSVVQTADGGFAVAGSWDATTFPGECCNGPLLLKLGATGVLDWQRAYNGGVYCFDTATARRARRSAASRMRYGRPRTAAFSLQVRARSSCSTKLPRSRGWQRPTGTDRSPGKKTTIRRIRRRSGR
jgi:hypothetical protein